MGWTDKLTGSQSAGVWRKKTLSLGGPQGPVSGWEGFLEEVTFKLGLEGKTTSKFLKKIFSDGLFMKDGICLRELMRNRMVVGDKGFKEG